MDAAAATPTSTCAAPRWPHHARSSLLPPWSSSSSGSRLLVYRRGNVNRPGCRRLQRAEQCTVLQNHKLAVNCAVWNRYKEWLATIWSFSLMFSPQHPGGSGKSRLRALACERRALPTTRGYRLPVTHILEAPWSCHELPVRSEDAAAGCMSSSRTRAGRRLQESHSNQPLRGPSLTHLACFDSAPTLLAHDQHLRSTFFSISCSCCGEEDTATAPVNHQAERAHIWQMQAERTAWYERLE